MKNFTYNDFRWLEKTPTSPKSMQWGISNLVYCSVNTKAKVESVNPETGEYRIVLQGTLDMNNQYGDYYGNNF